MKLFKAAIYILLFVLPTFLVAQTSNRPVCGTDEFYRELCKKDPSVLLRQQEAENLLLIQYSGDPSQMAGQATTTIIPVVFHVIHMNGDENISESAFKDEIKRLNEDYKKLNADTINIRSAFKSIASSFNIEFRLARIDPQGNCTNGITRYYSDLTENAGDAVKALPGQRWDTKKYLNVWVVKTINSSGSVGTVLGYSYFPWTANTSIDGVVIRADRIGYDYTNRTLTHEIGHYLGLYHTFEGGCSSDCASGGDKVCDTPPAADMNFGCDKTINSCHVESPDQYDMIENYMDYADCSYMFTTGQRNRVWNLLTMRSVLSSNTNLIATGVLDTTNFSCRVVADFVPEQYTICAGTPLTFINTSKISSSVWYQWQFNGGSPYVTKSKNPSVTYASPGKYDVKLIVHNSLGADSITKQQVVVVYPQNGFNTLFHEGFESAILTPDYWIVDPSVSNIGWSRTSKSAYTGGYSFYVNNFACTQTGQSISFTLPPVNLTGLTAPVLTFKHAFASVTTSHSDKLVITVSDDCGTNWAMRKTINPYKLPTTSTLYTSEFIPNNSSLWVDNIIDLSAYANSANLLVKFEFTTGSGNNLYIDDIRIGLQTGINDQTINTNDLSVYPNPVNNILYLNLPSIQSEDYSIIISDLLGNQLYSRHLSGIQNNISFISLKDAGIVKNGMYLIRLITKNRIYSKTFSVTE
jgi:PKD repeat protein